MYHVNLWGSKPGENDDCYTGDEFKTLEDAMKVYDDPWSHFGNPRFHDYRVSVAWIELDGPDVHEERRNPEHRESKDDDDAWRREIAMEAGMAFGCAGYNEVMGWD